MKTRTRTALTTETSSANPDLPAGYDDPDSPFYWPPEARERSTGRTRGPTPGTSPTSSRC